MCYISQEERVTEATVWAGTFSDPSDARREDSFKLLRQRQDAVAEDTPRKTGD